MTFSYKDYLNLIQTLQQNIPLVDFSDIHQQQSFFILRHDVEFSIQKAHQLAQLEHDVLKIQSSYFFQLRNATYNPLAFQNIKLIQDIHAMGHHIGLHVNTTGLTSFEQLPSFIQQDVDLLQRGIGCPINRFSFHRPTHHLLQLNLKIQGLINAYNRKFFHLDAPGQTPSTRPINYFSDSEHRWKYGDPLSILNKPIKKIQLLIHPYSWSDAGLNNTDNFKALIQSKTQEMIEAMRNECQHFPTELLPHEKI